jgi:hypothetical protein
MRRFIVFLVAVAGGPVASPAAAAENILAGTPLGPYVTPYFTNRVRGEFVDWFEPLPGVAPAGAQRYNFFGNQMRFGTKVKVPYLDVIVEGQDVRLANLPDDASGLPVVGNLGPGANYFFHSHGLGGEANQGETILRQANGTVSQLPWLPGFSATGGRFEYNDGLEWVPPDPALAWVVRSRIAERLVGTFGYSQYGRTFDGARAVFDQPLFNLTAIGARPTDGGFERSGSREIGDVGFAGVTATLKELPGLSKTTDVRLFYLAYEDDRFADERDDDIVPVKVDNRALAVRKADTEAIRISSIGTHIVSVADAGPGRVDALFWGVFQSGTWGQHNHHQAWAYAAEAGYQLPSVWGAPWLRVGFDQSSGDDDPNDGEHNTFFEILPTVRLYAQTPFYSEMNLQDAFAQLLLKPHPKVFLRTDFHVLRLNEKKDLWYAGSGATNDDVFGFSGIPSNDRRELADLVDISVTWTPFSWLRAYAYYGHAFGQGVANAAFAGTGLNYGYVELTVTY